VARAGTGSIQSHKKDGPPASAIGKGIGCSSGGEIEERPSGNLNLLAEIQQIIDT
jgi:hypothetical protein